MTDDQAWQKYSAEAKEWHPIGRKIYDEGLAYEVVRGYILDRPSPRYIYTLSGDRRSGFQVMERTL